MPRADSTTRMRNRKEVIGVGDVDEVGTIGIATAGGPGAVLGADAGVPRTGGVAVTGTAKDRESDGDDVCDNRVDSSLDIRKARDRFSLCTFCALCHFPILAKDETSFLLSHYDGATVFCFCTRAWNLTLLSCFLSFFF